MEFRSSSARGKAGNDLCSSFALDSRYLEVYILSVGRRTDFGKGVMTMKTSLTLPEEVWKAAKIRAVQEGKNLQEVVAEALRVYLKTKGKEEKK
jgi:hypothetical protein